ncbi:hypothetical protein [Bacillus coahuilensis]|uniref:hypothetical protein n=1 Tax=Bacillus coahuilensis TaxID=408580 RepID=UPI0001851307|nr:hypothetical protein [Bacillus coahuilensis]
MSDNVVQVYYSDRDDIHFSVDMSDTVNRLSEVMQEATSNALNSVRRSIEESRNAAPLPDYSHYGSPAYVSSIHGSFKPIEEVKLLDNKYKVLRYLKQCYNYFVEGNEEDFYMNELELALCFMQDYVYYDEELTKEQIRRINGQYLSSKIYLDLRRVYT